jgi:hypothetical protein
MGRGRHFGPPTRVPIAGRAWRNPTAACGPAATIEGWWPFAVFKCATFACKLRHWGARAANRRTASTPAAGRGRRGQPGSSSGAGLQLMAAGGFGCPGGPRAARLCHLPTSRLICMRVELI